MTANAARRDRNVLVDPERPLPSRYAPYRDFDDIDDGDVAPLRAALRHQLGRTNDAALAATWSVTDALGHPEARRDFAAAVMAIADPRWADAEAGLDDRLREPSDVPPPSPADASTSVTAPGRTRQLRPGTLHAGFAI